MEEMKALLMAAGGNGPGVRMLTTMKLESSAFILVELLVVENSK